VIERCRKNQRDKQQWNRYGINERVCEYVKVRKSVCVMERERERGGEKEREGERDC
jgi:hypothetical protein